MWPRLLLAGVWLAFQLGAIAYARFVPARYFCWAPYDTQTEYWVTVRQGDRQFSPDEIRQRYRRPAHGFDNRSPQERDRHVPASRRALPSRGPGPRRDALPRQWPY